MNNLPTVTITGADAEVDPAALVELSRAYPFVEWGILRSDSREGLPRYPDWKWRESLQDAVRRGQRYPEEHRARLSMHLCGSLARKVMAGDHSTLSTHCNSFRRVQLNGWSQYRLPGLNVAENDPFHEFIAQATTEQAFVDACEFVSDHRYKKVSILWDPSGGRGFHVPFSGTIPEGVSVGFAGGIHAENVVSVIEALSRFARDFWIDMESGIRTGDRFDLDKVVAVLELCRPYVKDSAP